MKLYNVKAIARILNLSERRVRQLKEQNIISEYKGKPGLYDLVSTVHDYINYLRNRNPDSGENIDYNTERARLVRAKRKLAETELAALQGDLHSTADIEMVMSDMLINFKTRLMSVPAKLSPVLAQKRDKGEIYRILKAAVDEALWELADFDKAFNPGQEAGSQSENGDEEVI